MPEWWDDLPSFPDHSYASISLTCEILAIDHTWDLSDGFLTACQRIASGASNNATARIVEDKIIYQLTAVKYKDRIAVTRVNLGPEQESKNDEKLYSAAFKASPIPLFITDIRGKQCVGINEAASREFADASGNAKRTKVEPFSPSDDNTAFLPWDKCDEMAVSSLLEGGTGFCEFETGNARSSSCRQAFRVAGREEPYIVGTIEYSASDLVPSAVYDATSELCDGDMRNSEILPNGQPGMAKSMCNQTLDALLRVTTEPITVCRVSGDNKLICVVANDAACQACGLPHADVIGFDYDTIMSKFEHFGEISEQVRQDDDDLLSSLDNKGPISAHKTYTLGSGHGFDRVSMAFRLPGDAQPYIVSKVHDITESMRCDKELEIARDEAEQSRNMARAMLHVIPIPVSVRRVSEDNKFIYVEMNEAACQVAGLSRDQVIGVDDESVIAARRDADPERVAWIIARTRIIDNALLESLAAGDPQVLQGFVTIESGASFDRFVKIFTIPGDDQPYIMSVMMDITELKDREKQLIQAKDEAEKANQMLTTILNVIPEPITVRRLGENGASFFVEANEVACKKFGTTREELIGKDDMSATLAMPEMTEEIANDIVSAARQMDNTLLTALAEDTQPVSLQMTWTNKQGKSFDRRVQAFKMPGDEQAYVASISINITELKNHEQQLMEAREAAERATRAKSTLLSLASHELRTPLNGILGMTDALALSSPLTADQQQQLKDLRLSGSMLLNIVNDILDMSKLESDQQLTLVSDPFRVDDVVKELDTLISHYSTSRRQLTYSINVDKSVPEYLMGDSQRVKQILFNLVSNALKFTTEGSIVMSIGGELSDDGTVYHLTCSVVDTGCGIPADKLDVIFDAFTQSDTARGTGLGLTISRKLAKMMGGTLTCESQVGVGSTFVFNVPQATCEAPTVTKPRTKTERNRFPMHLTTLVAEDNAVNLAVAQRFLKKMLADPLEVAMDGVEAVKMASAKKYDLILMDIQMPRMDGLDATRQIRQLPGDHRPVIVAMTANAMQGDRKECIDAGCDDYISKPISMDELEEILLSIDLTM